MRKRCRQPTCAYPSCRCSLPFDHSPPVQLPRIQFRPLLIHGCIASVAGATWVLIDSEQSEAEQVATLWHETLHLLGLRDEDQVEAMAQRLAQACPEILELVKVAHG